MIIIIIIQAYNFFSVIIILQISHMSSRWIVNLLPNDGRSDSLPMETFHPNGHAHHTSYRRYPFCTDPYPGIIIINPANSFTCHFSTL